MKKEHFSKPGYEYDPTLYIVDNEAVYNNAMGGGYGTAQYRRATDDEIRNGFQAVAEKREEAARLARLTDAQKDLLAIKEAKAEEDFKKGNAIIRDRDCWRQGGSMFTSAEYHYWDGSVLKWHDDLNPGYKPYWG